MYRRSCTGDTEYGRPEYNKACLRPSPCPHVASRKSASHQQRQGRGEQGKTLLAAESARRRLPLSIDTAEWEQCRPCGLRRGAGVLRTEYANLQTGGRDYLFLQVSKIVRKSPDMWVSIDLPPLPPQSHSYFRGLE